MVKVGALGVTTAFDREIPSIESFIEGVLTVVDPWSSTILMLGLGTTFTAPLPGVLPARIKEGTGGIDNERPLATAPPTAAISPPPRADWRNEMFLYTRQRRR